MSENVTSKQQKIVNPFSSDKTYEEFLNKLNDLRKDGENKIIDLHNENSDIRANRLINKQTKKELIDKNKALIEEAKKVKAENKEEVNSIIKEAEAKSKVDGKLFYDETKKAADERIVLIKEGYKKDLEEEKAKHIEISSQIKQNFEEKSSQNADNLEGLKKEYKAQLNGEKIRHKSRKAEIKSNCEALIQKEKDEKYNAYSEKYHFNNKVRNGRPTLLEKFENWHTTYAYNFKLKPWLIKNALYIIIVLFFLVSIFAGLGQGKNLLTYNHISAILGQSSVKVFYSLGVAGLILLAGTDLSIGRMTGLGACFANMILANTVYESSFGFAINLLNVPMGVRVIIAFIVVILLCVLFSAVAGFFSAKFKMHPFITTLSTQLLIYGLLKVSYPSVSAFTMDMSIKNALRGDNYLNIIIGAIIVIAIMWFIWNKTKFGKNMYAVGGNPEAASVSGISVFWVTMGVFIMAGVLYGFGGIATALQGAGANPDSGFGTELDAIAAAVVGGISFSGGIGKISGAVIGTLIFQGMTYCLTFLGLDVNIQFIFKGIIIMLAVCLDSIKYLKKK